MTNIIDKLGGRKAVALWCSMLVVLLLLGFGKLILPADLAYATMLVEKSLGFLALVIGIFVGGNAVEHVTTWLKARNPTASLLSVPRPSDEPKP